MIGPRISTSPSSASLISILGRVAAARSAGLGHAPQLRKRQPERVEELDHLARGGRGAHVERLQLVEAQHRADLREHLLVGLGVIVGKLRRDLLAGLIEPHLLEPDLEGPLRGLLAFLVLLGLDSRLERGLELLPDPRHREEPGRANVG